MFMLPEPPPLDYYITDVSPSYLSDGIFYHGEAAPCHKYIAKQLKPIKRTLADPVVMQYELDWPILFWRFSKEKGGFVYASGKDGGLIFNANKSMPKWKHERKGAQESQFSIFPRSAQYELSHIRARRLKDLEKCKTTTRIEDTRKEEETVETDREPCRYLEPPFWWKSKAGKPCALPVGNIDDYTFERAKEQDVFDAKISEKLHMDHPKKYIPGVIHQIKNPEDTGMKDVLERADAFKVALRKFDTTPKDSPPVDKCICSPRKSLRDSKLDQDLPTVQTAPCIDDRRWYPRSQCIDLLISDAERHKELRKLTKPILHELHTWYSKNKPTKLMEFIGKAGKRPIPGTQFSHL